MSKFEQIDEMHKTLLSRVNSLSSTADSIGISTLSDIRDGVDDCVRFLANELIPFCEVSHAVMYPVVGEMFGSLSSTNTMSYDIVEMRHLTTELEKLHHILNSNDEINTFEANQLRAVLHGLHAVATLHLTKEAEIYVSMLEKRLTNEEIQELLDRVNHALSALK